MVEPIQDLQVSGGKTARVTARVAVRVTRVLWLAVAALVGFAGGTRADTGVNTGADTGALPIDLTSAALTSTLPTDPTTGRLIAPTADKADSSLTGSGPAEGRPFAQVKPLTLSAQPGDAASSTGSPRRESANGEEPPMFPEGTQALGIRFSGAIPFHSTVGTSDATFYEWSGDYSLYVLDNFAIYGQLTAAYVSQLDGPESVGFDFSLMLRWHFFQTGRWTVFIDAGAGVADYDQRITFPDGTRFNFIIRGGPGFTYKLQDNLHLISGVQYHHVSNASLNGGDRHTGSDDVAIYAGLMWTF